VKQTAKERLSWTLGHHAQRQAWEKDGVNAPAQAGPFPFDGQCGDADWAPGAGHGIACSRFTGHPLPHGTPTGKTWDVGRQPSYLPHSR
jgi:hypothetical protein